MAKASAQQTTAELQEEPQECPAQAISTSGLTLGHNRITREPWCPGTTRTAVDLIGLGLAGAPGILKVPHLHMFLMGSPGKTH